MNDLVSGMTSLGFQKKQIITNSTQRSSSERGGSLSKYINAPIAETPGSIVQVVSRQPSNDFVFNSQEIHCTLMSSKSSSKNDNSQTEAADLLPITMNILIDNEDEVKPVLHDAYSNNAKVKPTVTIQESILANNAKVAKVVEQDSVPDENTGIQGEEDEIFSSPEGVPDEPKKLEVKEGKVVTELTKSAEDKMQEKDGIQTTEDILNNEPYKINIPLKKNVNKSTQKKLWREIERRKPCITQNVAMHIQNYAKPPFITWGCKGCRFPHEIQSYSKEYWRQ